MSEEERHETTHRAEEIARLFIRIADERPAVLDALHALLTALASPQPSRTPATGPSPESPVATPPDPPTVARHAEPGSPPDSAPAVLHEPPQPSEAHAHAEIRKPAGAPPAPPPAPPPARVSVEPTPEAKRGLELLKNLFGDLGGSSGLGLPATTAARELSASRWDDDIDEAKRLARLLRAQARRLRSIRLALHGGLAIPPVDHVLADSRIEDWTTDASRVSRLGAHDLREGERWYTLAARAAVEIGDWLSEHPDATLGGGKTPDALRDRLQCLANAQKGIHCWIEQTLGPGRRCEVQSQTHRALKAWVARDYFAVFLPSGLALAQRITSAERDEAVRALQRFELEHVSTESDEPAQNGHAHAEPAPTRRPAAETADAGDRFDSVHEAFLAARTQFSDGSVVFTERAEESAEDSAFKRPDEVFDFFRELHGIAAELREGLLEGRRLDHVFADRGFKSKLCSPPTMKRYHRFYHMIFEGSEVGLSQHVTLGSRNQNTCMSIHWWHDKTGRRFVIGHCGKHLPNTRS
jgi:hypothetical protein